MQIRSDILTSHPLPKSELIIAILLILLAFFVRLHNLEGDSYWVDEISTTQVTDRGWRAIQGNVTHPGLFFLITTGSFSVFGDNEFAGRLLSLFTGTLAIALIILAGKMLGRTSIGLWAALLLALSPLHLRHSQEARMYAQLMFLSLLSFILLYQALKHPSWPVWVAYVVATVLNLYTHYGALIVLASQSVLIAMWSIRHLLSKRMERLVFPIASAVLVAIIYAPWIPRFLDSLKYNVGSETVTHTGTRAPLMRWLRLAYHDFAMFDNDLAILFLVLCLLGLVFWVINRRWLDLAWILSGLLLPLVLISVFQVARGAISRYIIYMLPFYLLAIAYALDSMLNQVNRRMGNAFYSIGIIGVLVAFVWVAWPKIQNEHDFVREDWKGIVHYLDQNAEDGDVLLSLAMDFRSFNNVNHALPTYLQQSERRYQLLNGNKIRLKDLTSLSDSDKNVWAVVSRWTNPIRSEGKSSKVTAFENNLYVVHHVASSGNVLEDAIELYEQLLPFAKKPMPECLLRQDLSALYLATQDYWMAKQHLNDALIQCPNLSSTSQDVLAQKISEGFESQDWSQLVEYLDDLASDGDLIFGLNMLQDRSDKRVAGTLPYYLEQSDKTLQYLLGNPLNYEDLEAIDNQQKDLWLVASLPDEFVNSAGSPVAEINTIKIDDGIYLIHDPGKEGKVLDQVIDVYFDWLISSDSGEETLCALQNDVTHLFLAAEDYGSFAKSMDELEKLCEKLLPDDFYWQGLQSELHNNLRHVFERHEQEGNQNKAREVALLLLEFDPKDNTAIEVATADNLMERFHSGEVIVSQNGAPEPVEPRQFIMPHNGDWGDVIFMHPPGSASFTIELPDEPVALRSRVALDPVSREWGGDGVTFVVSIEDELGSPVEIFRDHVPNDESGHDWQDVFIPLTKYIGQTVTITLRTEVGPAGDGTGDWAGWETPRLLWNLPDIDSEMN